MKKGKTFMISGPSGVGKSTVLKALLERRPNVYFSVSATTRDPRPGELDGIHYHFMDVESFRKWIAMDQFLEYAEYVGNFYGTPKRFVDEAMEQGKDVILDIEVQGARQVMEAAPEVQPEPEEQYSVCFRATGTLSALKAMKAHALALGITFEEIKQEEENNG